MKKEGYKLMFGDCLKVMSTLPDSSVQLVAADLPYGTTNNRWDAIINLEKMWEAFERIVVPNGMVVLTATQPFVTSLITSNKDFCKTLKFRYDLIWEKTISSGQLNVKRQPMRSHEHIIIFSKPKATYNEQKTKGKPYSIHRKLKKYNGDDQFFEEIDKKKYCITKNGNSIWVHLKTEEEKTLIDEAAYVKIENEKKKEGYTAASLEELEKAGWVRKPWKNKSSCYGVQSNDIIKENDGFRHARSVIKISNPRIRKSETGGHPTQKPEELMSYIIKTYSNEGDVVLDCCMGSGTTGVVAIQEGRLFIGVENDEKYFEMATKRIKNSTKNSKGMI